MALRLFIDTPLMAGLELTLPADAARHVQVRRLQPADTLCLFNGHGGEWQAQVVQMGRKDVAVRVLAHEPAHRELAFDLEIALGMPANERMDALIEKATELGVSAISPLHTERSVLRLDEARARRRVVHWQAVATGAAEQSGRTHVPVIAPVRSIASWLAQMAHAAPAADAADAKVPCRRYVMSTGPAPRLAELLQAEPVWGHGSQSRPRWLALSGPEGGLTPDEEAAAVAHGFTQVSLGAAILRADTAPLAWLAQMAVLVR